MLTITLPGFADIFGYGYAVLAFGTVPNATTINLFSGTTNVGSLSYNPAPDPLFAGGFAGIQSTIPFDRVALTFSTDVFAFAVDNVRFSPISEPPPIPEPSTTVLFTAGLALLLLRRRARPGS